jgi:hypothetical protein
MSLLLKLGAIAILVWFYLTGKEKGANPTHWAVIGFVGYCLMAAIAHYAVYKPLSSLFMARGMVTNATMLFLVGQIPAVAALVASVFVRMKLIANLEK